MEILMRIAITVHIHMRKFPVTGCHKLIILFGEVIITPDHFLLFRAINAITSGCPGRHRDLFFVSNMCHKRSWIEKGAVEFGNIEKERKVQNPDPFFCNDACRSLEVQI